MPPMRLLGDWGHRTMTDDLRSRLDAIEEQMARLQTQLLHADQDRRRLREWLRVLSDSRQLPTRAPAQHEGRQVLLP